MNKRFVLALAALGFALVGQACTPKNRDPVMASSAGEMSYATHYPDVLGGSLKRIEDWEKEAKKNTQALSTYPGELKGVEPELTTNIMKRADEAGRSRAYVERAEENAVVEAFFEEDRDVVVRKVAGAAQYQAKQKGCNDIEVSGTVAHSLKEAVDKQLEKRIRGRSDAQYLIEKRKVQLGKENAAALEKQADDISRASFLLYVALPNEHLRLARLSDEASTVKHTLEATIADEQAYQKEPGRTDPEKKASTERLTAAQKAMAAIDPALERSKAVQPTLEKEIKTAQDEHAAAFKSMLDKLRGKN